jgi:hypothetical protein
MSLRVYLSGKMSNRYVEDVKSERKRATTELARYGIRAVDPAASEELLWDRNKRAKISAKFTRRVMSSMVDHDLFLIRRSDAILVLTGDVVSEGTLLEWRYAQIIGIPVIMIAPQRLAGDFMGWVNILVPADHTFPDIKLAAKFIFKRYVKQHIKNKAYFDAAIKNATDAVNKGANKKKRT